MIKRSLVLFCFIFFLIVGLCAVDISGIEREGDGEMTVLFCGLFKIENIDVKNTPAGEVILMPQDKGGYKNLIITSKNLDEKLKTCFNAKCAAAHCKNRPQAKIISADKLKNYNSVLATFSLDGEISATVFVSKIVRKKGGVSYRVKFPQDLKFLNGKYRAELRQFLIAGTKHLL
jgi:hypothetical protein